MRTRNEALHERKRAAILAAARRCFVATGFHQTGMQQICREARMSPGALYRYFPSKESIIAAMADQERSDNRRLMESINAATNVLEGVLLTIRGMASVFADREFGRLTLDIGAEAARNPAVARIFDASEREVRADLTAALKRGQASGHINKVLDAPAAAHLLISIIDGLIGRAAFPLPVSRKNLTATLSQLVRRFLAP